MRPENLLRHETSPYLLQHRDNPVHWRGWNEAALAEARANDRPILLSIGYAACHWCHVMAHESFEDDATAAVMNRHFVNIKVDREERPDIDQVYMAALHALGEQGGWPLTMFLTADAKPIWGGTYFPKTARFGRPAFVTLLTEIARLYRDDRDALLAQSERITAHLSAPRPLASGTLAPSILDAAADTLLPIMDRERGGTKGAPKFPNAPLLGFLAASAERTGRADLSAILRVTLQGLGNGGIFDHVGGGFARYSTDERWLVPHFEKMLSDNGLLLTELSYAARHDKTGLFERRIETTIDWLSREMRLADGAFAASLDADSDGHEGRYYVWTLAELRDVLGLADGDRIARAYDVTESGNWEGVAVLNRSNAPLDRAAEDELRPLLDRLLAHRIQRPPPARDDKLLVDWNGYAVAGLADAGRLLRRNDWIATATEAYRATIASASMGGRLGHAVRAGKRVHPGFSTDLAAMAEAALALHQATQQPAFLTDAAHFLDDLEVHHADGKGAFFLTADDGETLIVKKADRFDDAVPNAHGLAAGALVKLWALTGNDAYRARADAIFDAAAADIAGNVFGAASLLAAFDLRLRIETLLIIVPDGAFAAPLRDEALSHASRTLMIDVRPSDEPLPPDHPGAGKTAIDNLPTAYLCREGACSLPVTEVDALRRLLD